MALEQHPPQIRKKIALYVTVFFALALIVIFIVVYSSPKERDTDSDAGTKLGKFYETILEKGQAYFSR